MWRVVNAGGTGAHIQMAGFDIAGKTGTAQVVGLGRTPAKTRTTRGLSAYAPAYKPEIAMVALIENSGFGGTTLLLRFAVFTMSTIARPATKNLRARSKQIAKKEAAPASSH